MQILKYQDDTHEETNFKGLNLCVKLKHIRRVPNIFEEEFLAPFA